jgi:hypothetical protein
MLYKVQSHDYCNDDASSVARVLLPDYQIHFLLNIGFITSVGVQVCDRRPSVRRVFWLTMHNKLSQD